MRPVAGNRDTKADESASAILSEISLNHKSGVPLHRQIVEQIRYGIAAGKWKTGEQLPTVGALAAELKINSNTVSKAYKELEVLKILETQHVASSYDFTFADFQQQLQGIEKESGS
jgi:DNA-binding transcriptional regulator YhcF (GntR family)